MTDVNPSKNAHDTISNDSFEQVLKLVLPFLDAKELGRVSIVSRHFEEHIKGREDIWKLVYERKSDLLLSEVPPFFAARQSRTEEGEREAIQTYHSPVVHMEPDFEAMNYHDKTKTILEYLARFIAFYDSVKPEADVVLDDAEVQAHFEEMIVASQHALDYIIFGRDNSYLISPGFLVYKCVMERFQKEKNPDGPNAPIEAEGEWIVSFEDILERLVFGGLTLALNRGIEGM